MKTKTKIVLIFCLFWVSVFFAQNYSEESKEFTQNIKQEQLLYLDQIALTNKTINNKAYLLHNAVYIIQEGNSNTANVSIEADKSEVSVLQNGNRNEVLLDLKADVVYENVVQIGDDLYFADINKLGNKKHQVDVYQKGRNQKIIMNGINTISEKMKIKQIGTNKTIYINSF